MPIIFVPYHAYKKRLNVQNKNKIIMPYGLWIEKNTFNE
jgi:hypothetical protein